MTIEYTVSMSAPETHYFEVEMLVPPAPSGGEKIRLVMPVWTPGSYLVREFSRNVLEFKATKDNTGKQLDSYKDSKNSWIIETDKPNTFVRVQYRVYAFEFTVDTSYLDTRHGIINGASVFMYVDGRQNEDISLSINPFSEWKVIATSLDVADNPEQPQKNRRSMFYTAENFDNLVDCPIEIGNQDIESFEVEGVKHEVSMFGPKPIEKEDFVSDLKKIVEAEWKVFDIIPYKRYLFLVDFSGGGQGGGLEHLSSTHCIAPRLRLTPPEEYRLMMGLFSHELFHAWNVKRMRPQGLGPFNYSSETYTKSLWIAEGITSYYDDLILRRAGIYGVGDYLDAFCITMNQLRFLPSIKYESAEESSFDTWIKHYRPNENTPNIHSSYYFQGAVIGWMLDMEIRKSTKNKKTLDDAMRKLYNQTYVKEGRGYTEDEFERICVEIAGQRLSKEIFDIRVRSHEEVDFDRYLGYAGLKIGTKSKSEYSKKGYLGVKLKNDGGKVIIASKLFFTPAEKCGIAAGDEIIALDNLRVDSSIVAFYISNKKPGERISILISRDGYLETLNATVGQAPQFDSRIYKKEDATNEEKEEFKQWMLQDWDIPIEYPDYVPSPVRVKALDFI